MRAQLHAAAAVCLAVATQVQAQEPVAWGRGPDINFHTFSIVAIDPRTGETVVIVTTRNPCVGNAVPWVRVGVGAVATQGGTRVEFGNDLLDLIQKGASPQAAMDAVVAADEGRESRQVGVIDMQGRTDAMDREATVRRRGRGRLSAHAQGRDLRRAGHSLVSPAVVNAVADTFQASEGSVRTLADRMIDALTAGHRLGGDGRHGETQSAAVVGVDPRPGRSRRPDKQTVNINVCEHPEPLGELRRIYDTASETLGFRRLEQFMGRDVLQLKLMLHALGYFRPNEKTLALTGADAAVYTEEAVKALDAFRTAQQWGTTVTGFVDARVIERLWSRLKDKGLDDQIRMTLLDLQTIR